MKNSALQLLILTFVCINYITADLTVVKYESCVSNIRNLFRKCKDCRSIQEQIKFIFLYVVPVEFCSLENKIVQEYTEHLYGAVVRTTRFKQPSEFCEEFMPLKGLSGHTVNECIKKINDDNNLGLLGLEYTSTEHIIYNKFSLKDQPMYYFWYYIKHIQKSVDINESYDVKTPEKFCTLRTCEYEIRVEIPNLLSNDDSRYSEHGLLIMLNADYNSFKHKHSKDYVNNAYDLLDKESTIRRMQTPREYCNTHYYVKDCNKNCNNTMKSHNWNLEATKTKNVKRLFYTSDLDKLQYLKHMFYDLTKNNTNLSPLEECSINFIYAYMVNTSKILVFTYDNPMKKNLIPKNYCKSIH